MKGASIHELVVTPLRGWFGEGLPNIFLFAWIIPGIIIVALLFFYLSEILQVASRPDEEAYHYLSHFIFGRINWVLK